jgi:hypothetical protein
MKGPARLAIVRWKDAGSRLSIADAITSARAVFGASTLASERQRRPHEAPGSSQGCFRQVASVNPT